MKHRSTMYGMLAGTAALTGAMVALAQTPPSQTPPPTPPPSDKPRVPSEPPPRGRPETGAPAPGAPGKMNTPSYAQALTGTLPENTVQVFKDKDFTGAETKVTDLGKAHQAGTLNPLPGDFDNDASSMKWNIAPGTLVVLFDDAKGEGVQLALWGKGQIPAMNDVDFENSVTRWAWYDVGGGAEPRSAGNMVMPHGATALDGALPEDSIQLWEDQKFAGSEQQTISSVSRQASGTWNVLPGNKENGLSSMRWNLPEGVIVMFSAEDGGNRNIVIFGEGQNADLGAIGFDNRASRWTWANIGTPKGMSPPAGGDTREKPKPDAPSQPPPRQPSTPPKPETPSQPPPRQPSTPPAQPSTPPR